MPENMAGIQRAVQAIISRAKEILTQPLYDSADFVAATQGDVRYFNNTIATVGLLRTNMELAGQLAAPRQLLIQNVSAIPWSSQAVAAASVITADDCSLLAGQTTLTLTVSDKPYLRGVSLMFPGGLGVDGFAATTVAAADHVAAHSGVAHPMARFQLARPGQLLKPSENFNVVINVPVAIAGLSQSTRMYVVLWGFQLRAVQ